MKYIRIAAAVGLLICMIATLARGASAASSYDPDEISRPPVEIDGAWYMFADDFRITIRGSEITQNDDEKEVTLSYSNRAASYVVGSKDSMVFDGENYKTVKLDRAVWSVGDYVVIPIKKTCEALGIAFTASENVLSFGDSKVEIRFEERPKWAGIDLGKQQLVLYQGSWEVARYHISSGAKYEPAGANKYPEILYVVIVAGEGARSKTADYDVATPFKWYLGETKGDKDSFYDGKKAIHGYHDVPSSPASNGCFRVEIPNAKTMYKSHLLPLGSPVQIQLDETKFKPWRSLFPKEETTTSDSK